MNITAIERYIRVFTVPSMLVFAGVLGFFFMPDAQVFSGMLVGIRPYIEQAALATFIVIMIGLIWFLWAAWQLYRWETELMNGDCLNCGGHTSQKSYRHKTYRLCRYCGAKSQC